MKVDFTVLKEAAWISLTVTRENTVFGLSDLAATSTTGIILNVILPEKDDMVHNEQLSGPLGKY